MSSKSTHRKIKSLYIWHRYAGIIAALFVLVLSITGIALNHTERLKLDSSFIESEWLLDWYGIRAPSEQTAYPLNEHWLIHLGDALYLDKQPIAGHYTVPIGVIAFPHFIAIAMSDTILLVTYEGEKIEQLGSLQGVPSGMKKMGQLKDGQIVILASKGNYLTNRDFLSWKKQESAADVTWIESNRLPDELKQAISQRFRSNELPVERVILDLHSGRLFGSWGPMAMDIAAVILIFLAISGTWLWAKIILRKKQRRRQKKAIKH